MLREGAFLVARGRLAREETTGIKAFLDELVPLGGRGAQLSALAVAIEQRREDVPPPGLRRRWAKQLLDQHALQSHSFRVRAEQRGLLLDE